MKRLFAVFVLLVMLVFVVLAAPALAQEVTSEPPVLDTQVITVEPAPVIVTAPAADQTTVPNWYLLALPVLLVGLGSLVVIVQNVLHDRSLKAALERVDKSNKDAIEAAYEALPESTRDVFATVLNFADKFSDEAVAALKFLRQVTDGEANTDPPAPTSPSSMGNKQP